MAAVDTDTTKKEIREFIVEAFLFGDESEPFADDDSFMQNGVIDSTGVLEIVAFLEEKFAVRVADEEMIPDNLDSLDKLAAYVQRKKQKKH